jgi:hypothetical protein
MPNWCENRLLIKGPRLELVYFKLKMQGTDRAGRQSILNEDELIPYPEKYRILDDKYRKLNHEHSKLMDREGVLKMTKKQKEEWFKLHPYPCFTDGFNSGGHEWCCENWGTKWGFCEVSLDYITSRTMQYTFMTAWSPPVPLIAKMGELFPKLEFVLRYKEEGMDYKGKMVIKNGVTL